MPSADRLREFVAIVEAESISQGAFELGIPRATLSRRLSELEQELGVRLLHRDTRNLNTTEAGEELYRRARRVVADTDAAWASVERKDQTPRGPLRVSVPGTSRDMAELFVSFAKDYPEVRLEVSTSSRHVDLVSEGIDVAIRFGEVKDGSLVARRLFTTQSIAVASCEYLEAHGHPANLEDLRHHSLIAGYGGDATPVRHWPLLDGGQVAVTPSFASSTMMLQLAAVRRGVGIALLPRAPLEAELSSGQLLLVLPHLIGVTHPASLVFVDREFMPAQVRLFIERATKFVEGWKH